jgi:hypothetical protein
MFRGNIRTVVRQVMSLLGGARRLRKVSGLVKAIIVMGALFMCAICAYPLTFFFEEPPPATDVPAVTDAPPAAKSGEGAESLAACACSTDTYNCSDFRSQAAAQECYEYCMEHTAMFDVHGLDLDGNGVACEGWDYSG